MIGTYTGPGPDRRRRRAARAAGLISVGPPPGAGVSGGAACARRARSPTTAAPIVSSVRWRSTCAAPVGEPRDLAAQALDRDGELHAVGLDRVADLGRRALRHQRRSGIASPRRTGAGAGASRRRGGADGRRGSCAPLRSPSSGTGGAPRLTTRAAIRPASTPSSDEDHGHREEAPEVGEVVDRAGSSRGARRSRQQRRSAPSGRTRRRRRRRRRP